MSADVGQRRLGAPRRMMVTFLLLRHINQHQLRAHNKRQPHPQREKNRGVCRSRSEGGWTPLLYTYQTQRSRPNEKQRKRLCTTIFTG